MRICFLAPANSGHIVKWSRYFVSTGCEVHVISLTEGALDGATVHQISCGADRTSSDFKKLAYLTKGGQVRQLLHRIQPDIVNAHYATSYGMLAALSGWKHYIVSVWGSDVYDFPRKSPLHNAMLRYALHQATVLFSTSRAMASEASKYTSKAFEITPFGVDMDLFSPEKRTRTDGNFVVGTVKTLSAKYGIDYLLQAAGLVRKERPDIPLRLRIAGKGEEETKLKALAKECGVADITAWLGFISQEEAAWEWANFDLAVTDSSLASESFGVAAVEAQSCGVPIVISDVPGLMEATKPGETSVVVPRKNARALANAIISLYEHPMRRAELGAAGRRYVRANYELVECFHRIEVLYEKFAATYSTYYSNQGGVFVSITLSSSIILISHSF